MTLEQHPPTPENPKKLSELQKKALAIIISIFSTTSSHAGEDVGVFETNAPTNESTSLEINSLSKERFGTSLEEACEKAHCSLIVEKESENGKYIIHVGQTHARPPAEMNTVSAYEALASQQVIYTFLSQLDNPVVVNEGDKFASKSSSYNLEMRYENYKDNILRYNFGEKEFINYCISQDPKMAHLEPLNTEYSQKDRLPLLKSIGFSEGVDMKEKINEIAEGMGVPRKQEEIMKKMLAESISEMTQEYSFTLPFPSPKDQLLFAVGAVNTLSIEGKPMTYIIGETPLDEMGRDVLASIEKTGSDTSAMNNRDEFASTQAINSGDTLPIVVFGAAHSLLGNLENSPYGLIRIRTSDDTSAEGILDSMERE